MTDWPYVACVGALLVLALAGLWLLDARLAPTLALVFLSLIVVRQHAREARPLAMLERLRQADEVLRAGEGVGVTRHRSPNP